MTERLSDEDINVLIGRLQYRGENAMNQLHCGSENWEYRAANKEADLFYDSAKALRELLELRANFEELNAVVSNAIGDVLTLRHELADYKDVAASEADAVNKLTEEKRVLLKKLAAGPVMPKTPSNSVQVVILDTINDAIAGHGNWSGYGLYRDIRATIIEEQK